MNAQPMHGHALNWNSNNYVLLTASGLDKKKKINSTAPRKAKTVYNFGLSECNRVNMENKKKTV